MRVVVHGVCVSNGHTRVQNADAKVRDSAKLLAIELRRWLGGVMDKAIEALRPAQQKELKAAFDELPAGEKARATRLTRSKQKVAATQAAAGGGGGDAGAANAQEVGFLLSFQCFSIIDCGDAPRTAGSGD